MFFLGLVWAEDELIQDSDPVDSFGTDEVAGFELEPDDFEDPLGDYIPPFVDSKTEEGFKDPLINPYPWPFTTPKEELDISKEEEPGSLTEPPWEGAEIPLPFNEMEGEDNDCYAYSALYKMSTKIVVYGDRDLAGQWFLDQEAKGWVQAVSWTGYSGEALPHWVKFPPVFGIVTEPGGGKQYATFSGGRSYPFLNAAELVARDISANRYTVVRLIRIDSITVFASCGTFQFPPMDATQEAEQPAKEEDMNPCCEEEKKIKQNKAKPKKKNFSGESGIVTIPNGHVILEVVYKIQTPQQSTKAFSGGVLGEIHLSGSYTFDLGERLPFSFLEGKLHPSNDRMTIWAFTMKTGYTCSGKLLYYSTKP